MVSQVDWRKTHNAKGHITQPQVILTLLPVADGNFITGLGKLQVMLKMWLAHISISCITSSLLNEELVLFSWTLCVEILIQWIK